MIVNRVARRFTVALASAFLVAASDVADQDALTRAKDLYASAAYDDALAVLDQLKLDSSSPDVVEAGQYRAFCLLALGRSDEGRKAIAGIVEADPLFQPAETQMSPRLVTVFRDVTKAAAAANRPAIGTRKPKSLSIGRSWKRPPLASTACSFCSTTRTSRRHRARPTSECWRRASGISAGWLPHPRLPRRRRRRRAFLQVANPRRRRVRHAPTVRTTPT